MRTRTATDRCIGGHWRRYDRWFRFNIIVETAVAVVVAPMIARRTIGGHPTATFGVATGIIGRTNAIRSAFWVIEAESPRATVRVDGATDRIAGTASVGTASDQANLSAIDRRTPVASAAIAMSLTRRTSGAEIGVFATFVFDTNTAHTAVGILVTRRLFDEVREAHGVIISLAGHFLTGCFTTTAAPLAGAATFGAPTMKSLRAITTAIGRLGRKTRTGTKGALTDVQNPYIAGAAFITPVGSATRITGHANLS